VNLAHRGHASLSAKLPSLVRRLAGAYMAAGQLDEADVALREVREGVGGCERVSE